ncbi:hypothetical protein GETHLI_02410 [Geothrix limicola]|uniref:HPt domain-containing protein n=1 Tax=Geothrix limicola TaxID=2927978 RepID=A0ABQ5QA89_9BACT|nr:Hpt domain-containing protein [Geothrix limicola]GLH71739.1 hypothetical protein GETHLI_02410 [Geothrix limicola]
MAKQPERRRTRGMDLAGISKEAGLAHFAAESLYERVLGKFLESKSHAAEELRTDLARGDLEAAERVAHSMISAAGIIGALELAAVSQALQDALHGEKATLTEALLSAFERQLETVLEGLKTHFEKV